MNLSLQFVSFVSWKPNAFEIFGNCCGGEKLSLWLELASAGRDEVRRELELKRMHEDNGTPGRSYSTEVEYIERTDSKHHQVNTTQNLISSHACNISHLPQHRKTTFIVAY